MVILSVDHGTNWGMAVIEDGKLIAMQHNKLVSTEPADKFLEFKEIVNKLINCFNPDLVVAERPADKTNGRTVEQLIGLYSIVLLVAKEHGVPVLSVYPTSMKKVVAGSGTANKETVAEAMERQFGIKLIVPVYREKRSRFGEAGEVKEYKYDQADAVALAYYGWLKHKESV